MRYYTWLAVVTFMIAALAPAMAQRGGQPSGGGPRGPRPDQPPGVASLPGKVLSIDAAHGVAQVALYVRARDANAPGKVPDDMAQRAAMLAAQAKQLEEAGKPEEAKQRRRMVQELLRWREITHTIAPDQGVTMIALRRSPLSEIAVGDWLRMEVKVEGDVPEDQMPARVNLIKDVLQVGQQTPPMVRRQKSWSRDPSTFLILVGEVTGTAPLTLKVGERTVQVIPRDGTGYLRQMPVALRDIQPGQRFLCRASMKGPMEVERVARLIFFSESMVPLGPNEDLIL